MLSRPSLDEVLAYRAHVDRHMAVLLSKEPDLDPAIAEVTEIGLHHEQQHQELILTDLKHGLAWNPMDPVYRPRASEPPRSAPALVWQAFEGGLREIGAPDTGFAFDNERPAHREYLEPFELASRPVTNREWLQFIAADSYHDPSCWLSDGWAEVQRSGWEAPLYWRRHDADEWRCFTLAGLRELDPEEPVCHVSYYEADAYARLRPSGRSPPGRSRPRASSPAPSASIRHRRRQAVDCGSSTATSGSGRAAPTCPTPAFARLPVHWASTTASS
jgi:ergothioneine biosynthesis protein EgtB